MRLEDSKTIQLFAFRLGVLAIDPKGQSSTFWMMLIFPFQRKGTHLALWFCWKWIWFSWASIMCWYEFGIFHPIGPVEELPLARNRSQQIILAIGFIDFFPFQPHLLCSFLPSKQWDRYDGLSSNWIYYCSENLWV